MEDSGIDSGDKVASINFSNDLQGTKLELVESDNSSNENVEVVFRGLPVDTKKDHIVNKIEKIPQVNSCRILQRKLELKVERAKRNYKQLQTDESTKFDNKMKSSNLIPINRLQIPGCVENQPLVEYNSNQSDDDDNDDATFFPIKQKSLKKQDLSDTFSIQEMTIESDTDDSESQTLELLPPTSGERAIANFFNFICCSNKNN